MDRILSYVKESLSHEIQVSHQYQKPSVMEFEVFSIHSGSTNVPESSNGLLES